MAMKLVVKFNLVFIGVFLAGLLVAGAVSYTLLQNNARDEIVQNARIMMEAALSTRSYTSTQIKPLLDTQMKYVFLPQSVPAYAATEYFNDLRQKYPEYSYKEATLNPTNPRDRASDWEADLVGKFRQDAAQKEVLGERDTPTGRVLYLARPIQVKSESCLSCHSTVDAAPKTMLDHYGNANGFGWKLNEIVGAQIMSVPTAVPIQRANDAFKAFMLSLTGIFAFIFIALNLMLQHIVIRPVTQLSRLADRVSLGEQDVPEFSVRSRDEIGVLAESFGRLRKSLSKAMKMLED
jgi:protein-histidine pros-kinase